MFKERIKELRKERKWTQDDVAREINIARSSYSRYEMGDREPDLATVRLLSELFHVSSDYLLGITDDPIDYADFDLIADLQGSVMDYFDGDVKKTLDFQKAVAEDAMRENLEGSANANLNRINKSAISPIQKRLNVVARKAEDLTDDERETLIKHFEESVDLYLKARRGGKQN